MSVLTDHQKAALKFDRHISLTANAGSGKTFVLSKRYIEIALSQKLSGLRNIAAISFTDKAAGELYKKIAKEIEEKLQTENDRGIINKLRSLRRQLVSANISTIHSFCIDILRENPVEAGLDANFVPIDELLSDELIELSVDELIKNSFNESGDEEKLKYLLRILGSRSIFTKELVSLIKRRKNVLVIANNIYNKDVEEITHHFENSFLETLQELFENRIPFLIEAVNQINSEVLERESDNTFAIEISPLIKSFLNKKEFLDQIKILKSLGGQILTGSGTVKKRGYLGNGQSEFLSAQIELVENFYDELKHIVFEDDQKEVEKELAKFGKTLIYFFSKALEIYNNKKKENAYLDYEDILLFTQNIIEIPAVRQSLSKKYQYIMIDEYQDTNEIQYNIFLPILDHLRKGNLFVVGDEKQSIYMFRDAELEVFNRTKNDIDKTKGENKLLTLPESFRMAPAIALFTNKLFGRLFENPNLLFNEVGYNELISASDIKAEGQIEILLAKNPDTNVSEEEAEETGNAEDELIARRILKLIGDKKVNFNDVAILCRRRKEFKDLENSFVKNNIPFVVVGGKGFYQRQSVYDIYNYFSFLLDKDNDTALVGTLRSPFFNISDSDIFEISLADGKNYWEKFQKFSSGKNKFADAVKTLDENIRLSTSYDLTFLLRKIFDESCFLSVIASRANSAQELANIQKLTGITRNFNLLGFKTLYDYVCYLRESISQLEDESQAVVSDESNSVKIMTYHQAKGLEFKAVFLHKCGEGLKKESVRAKKISIDKKFGLLTKVPVNYNISSEYQKTPLVGIADLIEERKNIAEFKRLFYVGVTRAIEYLFICGTGKKEHKYDNNSIFGMMRSGLGIDFDRSEFIINSKLKFAKLSEDNFVTEERKLETRISVVNEIEQVQPEPGKAEVPGEVIQVKLNAEEIKDQPEGEFISATKVAVYKQCPLKYQLTYEYGFNKLFNSYKSWYNEQTQFKKLHREFEFNPAESALDKNLTEADENKIRRLNNDYSDVKGRMAHKILQNEIPQSDLREFITANLKNELDVFDYSDENAFKLQEDILADIKNFYSSTFFNELSSHKNYKNEYEIYIKENDYFLYGIIDKLIIEEKKLIIIDYKTDEIKAEEINERAETYLPQLEFYSYIVSKYFTQNSVRHRQIELKLAFIKHPDKIYSKTIDTGDFLRISSEIKNMVSSIRMAKFSKNLQHCSNCVYALRQEKCIINS